MQAARWVIVLLALLPSMSCTRSPGGLDASVGTPAPPTPAPPPINLDERYGNKPMLAVIEGYALAAIGQLPAPQEAILAAKVHHAFGGDDDWRAVVRKTMSWPANIDERIQFDWREFSQQAGLDGSVQDAQAFARSFGDRYAR